MADFMREDGEYFVMRMRGQKGVEKDDSLGFADAGKIGISVLGTFALVHLKNSFGLQPDFREQCFNLFFQFFILDRFVFVEERRDEHREKPQKQNFK